MRWSGDPGLSGFIAHAEIRDTAGHILIDPLRTRAVSIRSLGMFLQGEQMWFNARTPKAKCMLMQQAWFCTAEALPLHEWYEAWQAKLAQAAAAREDALFRVD